MADYNQPDYVEKRLRYFDGQLLKDQDFVDEQKYFIDRQRRYHRFLNVSGIIDGLTVTTAPDLVTVAPGTALDNKGRLIVLSDQVLETERQVPLRDYRGRTVDLVISYKEDPDPPTGNAPRFREKPRLTIVSGQSVPDGAIALAKLTVDNTGGVTVNANVRMPAGLRLPYDGAAQGGGPSLRAGSTNRLEVTGDLSVSGNVGIGTTTPKGFQVALPESRKESSAPGPGVTIAGGPEGNANIELRNNGSGTPYIDFAQSGTSGDYDARIRLTAPAKLAIEGAGLGIGTADPESYRLKVDGTLNVTGTSTLSGNTSVGGTLSVTETSTLTGSVSIGTASALSFGSQVRQMINLWSTNYGIGVQEGTQYFRTDKNFAWYKMGTHSNAELTAGTGGTAQMVIKDGNVGIGTTNPQGRLDVTATNQVGKNSVQTQGTRVSGVGPGFELRVGDTITVDGQTRTVTETNDANVLYVDRAFSPEITTLTPFTFSCPPALVVTTHNVSIGTADPGSDRLKVDGTLNVTSNTRIGGTLSVTNASTLTGNVGIGVAAPAADSDIKLAVNGKITGLMFGTRKGYANKVKTPSSGKFLLDPHVEASSDGFVVAMLELETLTNAVCWIEGVIIQRGGALIEVAASAAISLVVNQTYPIYANSFTMPVRRGETWNVRFNCGPPPGHISATYTIYWVPLGA